MLACSLPPLVVPSLAGAADRERKCLHLPQISAADYPSVVWARARSSCVGQSIKHRVKNSEWRSAWPRHRRAFNSYIAIKHEAKCLRNFLAPLY
jgi:hypothetical protein